MREDATLISIDGSALGGSSKSGYSSVTKPLKILVRSTGLSVLDFVGLGVAYPLFSPCFTRFSGLGDFSAKGSPAGEGVWRGVLGGNGMGARGGRGDKGTPGKFETPRGERGGELTGDLKAMGLGLEGRPGLIKGGGTARESGAPLKTPAREAGSREGTSMVVWTSLGLAGISLGGASALSVAFRLPLFLLFLD
jgi:hypothetical protein